MNEALKDPRFQTIFQDKTIRVIAPGSGVSADKFALLRNLPGLKVNFAEPLFTNEVMFHASADENRFEQLKSALYGDSEIIWFLRGGYGCARLIDKLAKLEPPKHQKTVIGFSDNTALHLFLSQAWQWQTIHGCVFSQLADETQNPESFLRIAEILSGKVHTQSLADLIPLNLIAKQSIEIRGLMQGGNLTLIENSIATSWQLKANGTLLFLEEVGEKGYRIDRALYHLRQAGLLSDVKAVIFGQCLSDDEKGVQFALKRFSEEMPIPIFQSQLFGHGQVNFPLIYHSKASIKSGETGYFSLDMQLG